MHPHYKTTRGPSFKGRFPASVGASSRARASSKKAGTKCELLLRQNLWRRGCRYRLDAHDLPGRPDLVFRSAKLVIFCDGDFWHGRNLEARLARLNSGHNSDYWIAKIERNVARDRHQSSELARLGWTVLRYWERDILNSPDQIAEQIVDILRTRSNRRQQ